MTSASKLLGGAAGTAAAGGETNIEDVFSTTLYNGTGAAQSITNGIDLAGEGGMIWFKNRTLAEDPMIVDTIRGGTADIYPNEANAVDVDGNISSFNSNGFTFAGNGRQNFNTYKYVSWTFRKSPKFFDVVTWNGDSVSGREIPHNLGCTVGAIFIKRTNDDKYWFAYHRSTEATHFLRLNENFSKQDSPVGFGDVEPTSTEFTVTGDELVNQTGGTYVAYLFADNASEDAENRLISCGSYAGNESTYPTITLGFEPQFLLIKSSSHTGNWLIFDTMRGLPVGGGDEYLRADTNGAETTNANQYFNISATGFSPSSVESTTNGNGKTFVYVAIRRPNMKTHTDATDLFAVAPRTNTIPGFASGFPVDFCIGPRTINGADNNEIKTRLISGGYLRGNTTGAETASNQAANFAHNTGFFNYDGANANQFTWMWKRAKGFFDVVAYTGNDTVRTIAHGLGVVPEMIWVKTRSTSNAWWVYYGDNTDYLVLNTTAATVDSNYPWQDTSPTSSVFTVGDIANVNENNATIIAYLFATLAGVSKIGTVTHSGSSTDVDCGFTAGARFVLLKRTDATGDWYFWDSVRGIVAGNDPYLLLNSTAAQVTNTDLIDPLASGFQISGDFTDGDYIFYAIA